MDEMDARESVVGRWGTLFTGGRLIRTHKSHGDLMCHWDLPSEYVKSTLLRWHAGQVTINQKHPEKVMRKKTKFQVCVILVISYANCKRDFSVFGITAKS